MNHYEAKQEARRQRLEDRAARLAREGAARVESGMERLRAIPFGQPILVGHHSEKRDRNYRRKAGASIDKGFELQKEAAEVAVRAASVGSGGISSDDPDAVVKLKEQLEKLKAEQIVMVAANKLVRKHRANPDAGVAELAKVLGGVSEATARKLFKKDFAGRIGFASYQLTNNGANIRRTEARIDQLKAAATREHQEVLHNSGVKLVQNVEENRVQLIFPGKPDHQTRTMLKGWGFRWSPMNGAWQRHLNNSGIYAAKQVLEKLTPKEQANGS